MNSKLATSQSIPPLVESNNKLAVSNHDKCIVLNDYFASVFTTDDLLPITYFRLVYLWENLWTLFSSHLTMFLRL